MPSSTSSGAWEAFFQQKEYVVDVGYSEEDVKRDVKKYLEGPQTPSPAFFAENDLIGCSAIRAMQESDTGYRRIFPWWGLTTGPSVPWWSLS